MDWKAFFTDLNKWMEASNQVVVSKPIDSKEYWDWAWGTLGVIEDRYNHHPLVVKILSTVVNFQKEQLDKIQEENDEV